MDKAWIDDPNAFLDNLGPMIDEKSTIERINNDMGYVPGNVCWASRTQQARNKRNTSFIVVQGDRISLPLASERWGVPLYSIRNRIRRGWSPEEALGVSPRRRTT